MTKRKNLIGKVSKVVVVLGDHLWGVCTQHSSKFLEVTKGKEKNKGNNWQKKIEEDTPHRVNQCVLTR